jgi:hypothetical protein
MYTLFAVLKDAVLLAKHKSRSTSIPKAICSTDPGTSAPAGTFVFGTLTGVFVSYRHLFGLEYGEALVIVDATTPSGMSFGLR